MPRDEVRGSQPGASDGRCSWWKEDQRKGRGRGVSRRVCVPRYNGSPKSHPGGQAGTYRTFLTFLTSSGSYLWLLLGRELRPPCDSSCPLKTARFVAATLFFFFFPSCPKPHRPEKCNGMSRRHSAFVPLPPDDGDDHAAVSRTFHRASFASKGNAVSQSFNRLPVLCLLLVVWLTTPEPRSR